MIIYIKRIITLSTFILSFICAAEPEVKGDAETKEYTQRTSLKPNIPEQNLLPLDVTRHIGIFHSKGDILSEGNILMGRGLNHLNTMMTSTPGFSNMELYKMHVLPSLSKTKQKEFQNRRSSMVRQWAKHTKNGRSIVRPHNINQRYHQWLKSGLGKEALATWLSLSYALQHSINKNTGVFDISTPRKREIYMKMCFRNPQFMTNFIRHVRIFPDASHESNASTQNNMKILADLINNSIGVTHLDLSNFTRENILDILESEQAVALIRKLNELEELVLPDAIAQDEQQLLQRLNRQVNIIYKEKLPKH